MSVAGPDRSKAHHYCRQKARNHLLLPGLQYQAVIDGTMQCHGAKRILKAKGSCQNFNHSIWVPDAPKTPGQIMVKGGQQGEAHDTHDTRPLRTKWGP